MNKMLYIEQDFEPFTAEWGAVVSKIPYNDGFICPLGWEEELSKRGIEFTEIDYEVLNIEDDE
jgi:hypothetical protein